MGSRGRKSAAELSVIGAAGVAITRRPEPPAELGDEMAEVWRAQVNSRPAAYFDAAAQRLLVQFCRHTVAARRVAQLIRQAEMEDEFFPDDWMKLLRAQQRESAMIATLATKLRTAPQSTYDKNAAARAGRNNYEGSPPWE